MTLTKEDEGEKKKYFLGSGGDWEFIFSEGDAA